MTSLSRFHSPSTYQEVVSNIRLLAGQAILSLLYRVKTKAVPAYKARASSNGVSTKTRAQGAREKATLAFESVVCGRATTSRR